MTLEGGMWWSSPGTGVTHTDVWYVLSPQDSTHVRPLPEVGLIKAGSLVNKKLIPRPQIGPTYIETLLTDPVFIPLPALDGGRYLWRETGVIIDRILIFVYGAV